MNNNFEVPIGWDRVAVGFWNTIVKGKAYSVWYVLAKSNELPIDFDKVKFKKRLIKKENKKWWYSSSYRDGSVSISTGDRYEASLLKHLINRWEE